MKILEAILILGPTGSGKTPLGQAFEKKGHSGRRCVHFDFGANLREIAGLKRRPKGFTDRDMAVIRGALATGALLEDENFPIAEKIMERFRRKQRMGNNDILVLNGLPRHRGQAADLESAVKVRGVVYLDAPLDVVAERIRRNTGGDRRGRTDDSPDEIPEKYAIFLERTKPLLDFYESRGVPVRRIPVAIGSTAEAMLGDSISVSAPARAAKLHRSRITSRPRRRPRRSSLRRR